MDKQKYIQNAKEAVIRAMRYNNGFVAVVLSGTILYLASSNSSLHDSLLEKDKQIVFLANQVTYVSDAGVVKKYEREQLDVYREKQNVQNVLAKYLVQSAFNLTDGYKRSHYANEEELFKSFPPFIEFFSQYVNINKNKASKERVDGYDNALRDWQQIVVYFKNGINKNNVPHVIDKKLSDMRNKIWETKEDTFKVRFLIPMYANSRNNNNAIDEGMTMAEIEATGYFNLMEQTTLNPRGMKFTSLKLLHPEIDHKAK